LKAAEELTKMPERSRQLCICVVLCPDHGLARASRLEPERAFLPGKTLRFVVGSAPANFYDSWARLIARYWGKHIPGNPNVIVQNMPGAGSITAVNYVLWRRQGRRLTVVLPNNSIYIEQLIGRREAQFDLRKYHWLGSAAQESIMSTCGRIRRTKTSAKSSGPNNAQLRRLGNHELRITSWRDSGACGGREDQLGFGLSGRQRR